MKYTFSNQRPHQIPNQFILSGFRIISFFFSLISSIYSLTFFFMKNQFHFLEQYRTFSLNIFAFWIKCYYSILSSSFISPTSQQRIHDNRTFCLCMWDEWIKWKSDSLLFLIKSIRIYTSKPLYNGNFQ